MTYRYLQTRRDGPVEYLTLNRPDVRNAFNDEVVTELRQWADGTALDAQVRVAVVAGAGKVFSAGADAAWMARMAEASAADNEADALATTAMLGAINTLPMVVIGRALTADWAFFWTAIAVPRAASTASETCPCTFWASFAVPFCTSLMRCSKKPVRSRRMAWRSRCMEVVID